MRNIHVIVFSIVLFLPLHVFCTTYYVSNSGSDLNEGTSRENAFQSINKINELTLLPGDSVLFETDGTYFGQLVIKNSGSEANPIIISAYGTGSAPIFSGFQVYAVNPATNATYCPECTNIDNLVVYNDSFLQPARSPNYNYLNMDSVNGSKSFLSESVSSISSDLTEAIVVARTEGWVIDRFTVSAVNNSEITVGKTLGVHTPYEFQENHGFFLTHLKAFLDKNDEWFFDTSTDSMYLFNSEIDTVLISCIDNAITLNENVGYIEISNIDVEGYRRNGITLDKNYNVTIKNCNFRKLGNDGIGLESYWGSYNTKITVDNCIFTDILNTSINLIVGEKAVIRNNTILRNGLIAGQGMMYDMGYNAIHACDSSLIEYNTVDSVGYSAITWSSGNYCEVRLNEVSNFCLVKNDGGGITCWSSKGNFIHHNYIHDGYGNGEGANAINGTMNNGIYMDDTSHDNLIENNTVVNCDIGILLHNNYNITVRKNTIYNNRTAQLKLMEGYPDYGEIMKNNRIENNSLQAIYPGSLLVSLLSVFNTVSDFAQFNYNVYNHPYNNAPFHLEYPPLSEQTTAREYKFFSFDEWVLNLSFDKNGKGTFDKNQKYGDVMYSVNLLKNSTFDNGSNWWWSFGNDDFSFSTSQVPDFDNNALTTNYNKSGFAPGYLGTSGFSVEKGKQYMFSFDIKGKKNGYAKMIMGMANEPYTLLKYPFDQGFAFSDEIATIEIPFYSDITTDASLILQSSSYSGGYTIDNVLLRELEYDTTLYLPQSYNKLFLNNSYDTIDIGIPDGFIHQDGNAIVTPIILEPFCSVLLKKVKTITQTISLQKGWNLVSTNISPAPNTVGDVFKNATIVKNIDSYYQTDSSETKNSLFTINVGSGYLVKNTINEDIIISGTLSFPESTGLKSGWNLIGVPVNSNFDVAQLPDETLLVKDFDDFYEPGNTMSGISRLLSGKAYFIKVSGDCEIVW